MFIHNKFIYVHLPRTGGSLISAYLKKYLGGEYLNAGHNLHLYASDVDKSKFKFGTIRNPWDWYPSFYEFLRRGQGKEKLEGMQFKEFLECALRGCHEKLNIGLLTYQYILFFCEYRKIAFDKTKPYTLSVDKVIKLENIVKDLPAMFAQHLFPFSTKQQEGWIEMSKIKINHSIRKESYQDYYDSYTKQLVAKKDKFIIETFNYSF